MLGLGRRPRIRGIGRFNRLDRVLGLDHAVEVKEAGLELDDTVALDGETFRREVVVLPVVVAGGDHLLQRLAVVDREAEGFRHHGVQLQHRAERFQLRQGAGLGGLRERGEIAVVQLGVVGGGEALLFQNGQRVPGLSGRGVGGAHRNSYDASYSLRVATRGRRDVAIA